jgi:spore maturation protein SpmA
LIEFFKFNGLKSAILARIHKPYNLKNMLNRLWPAFFLVSLVACIVQWFASGHSLAFTQTINQIFDMARLSVEISLGLVGILAFWIGIMAIAQASGIVDSLATFVAPVLRKLMPDVPQNHPAMGYMSLNISANVFGLDNAATPFGIKAMESLQSINPFKDTASNAQIMFLVMNTTSVTLFPVTIFMYRAQSGSAQATSVFLPIILATLCSTIIGLCATLYIQQRKKLAAKLLLSAAFAGGALLLISDILSSHIVISNQWLSSLANAILFGFVALVMLQGMRKKIAVYDEFIVGAKQGFELAVKIIPYLVAMLTAIGALRGSGVLDLITNGVKYVVAAMNYPTEFIDVLSVALMKPFSASGSRALMIDAFEQFGVDSIAGQIASIMQGSTETTFYVLSVYFGAVGISKIRHALGVGILGDLAGAIAAIVIGYAFFG